MTEIIEAQELCGAHVGRIIQFTLSHDEFKPLGLDTQRERPVAVGGELQVVSHRPGQVRVSLRGFPYLNPRDTPTEILLMPTDHVVVDAFEVVMSR